MELKLYFLVLIAASNAAKPKKEKPEFQAPPEKALDNPVDPDIFTFEGDTGERTHENIIGKQEKSKSPKNKSVLESMEVPRPNQVPRLERNLVKTPAKQKRFKKEPNLKSNSLDFESVGKMKEIWRNSSTDENPPPKTKNGKKYIRGCYYTNWAQDRTCKVDGQCDPPDAIYFPENYVPNLCTHIFFAFIETNDNQDIITSRNNDADVFKRLYALKKKQPDLKLLVSLGGWGFCKGENEDDKGNKILSKMAANEKSRAKFIKNALKFVEKIKFDGFDWDWEYPEAAQRDDFAKLLKEMYEVFHKNGLLMAAAVPFIEDRFVGYDVKALAKYLDFINIMSYDMHGTWSWSTLGHNSPLHSSDKLDVERAAQNWVNHGFPKAKIMIGLASYGRTWKVKDLASATSGSYNGEGPSSPGIYTGAKGFESYFEICQKISNDVIKKGNIKVDPKEKVPYAVYNDARDGPTFLGFDDEGSIQRKLQWLMKKGYGGAFFWTLDFDDFTGELCANSPHPYPLISQMIRVFDGSSIPKMSKNKKKNRGSKGKNKRVRRSVTTTAAPVSNSKKFDPKFDPSKDGCQGKTGDLFNPKDCSTYYTCITGYPSALLRECPTSLVFDGSGCGWTTECKAVA